MLCLITFSWLPCHHQRPVLFIHTDSSSCFLRTSLRAWTFFLAQPWWWISLIPFIETKCLIVYSKGLILSILPLAGSPHPHRAFGVQLRLGENSAVERANHFSLAVAGLIQPPSMPLAKLFKKKIGWSTHGFSIISPALSERDSTFTFA